MARNAQRVVKYLSPVTPPPVVAQPAPAVEFAPPAMLPVPVIKRSRNSYRAKANRARFEAQVKVGSIIFGGICGISIGFYLISTLEIYAHIWK